jgi:hypothetical protein
MFDLFGLCFGAIRRIFRTHRSLMLENLALRQQLAVLKRKHPRPRLGPFDKLFWVVARCFWTDWEKSLILVLPETVVRWHQAGFKLYWAMLCGVRKRVGGGRRVSKQIRDLIFQMVAENPTWGAPRIHGELLMLGFEVSETITLDGGHPGARPGELAGVSSQSPRSHRGDGFLHGPGSRSMCSTASSSLAMTVVASCTSMSLVTQRAVGLCSNFARPFPTSPRPSS